MIKAIAWDIDGTLLDSEPLHLFALQQVCHDCGVDISDLPDDFFVGVHLGNVWLSLRDRFSPKLDYTAWTAELNKVYAANTARLCPVASAVETIRSLSSLGVRQVAVSNSNRAVVDANLAVLGVSDLFEFTLSLDDVLEGKPDPFPYKLACARLRLSPSQVLAVEDSLTGVTSAKAASMPVALLDPTKLLDGTGTEVVTMLTDIYEMVSDSDCARR